MAGRAAGWQIVGVATAAALVAAALVGVTAGASTPAPGGTTYVSIVPCRLFDTRPAPATVGARTTPLGPDETHRQQVTGAVGNCVVPADATSVTINLTAARGTARSFLTVAPAGEPLPNASTLNWVAGAPPTPNQVTIGLSTDGAIDLHNEFGEVDLIGDVVGYGTTADLDAVTDRLDQVDGEIADLASEFNTLDDAVSTKANAADVYTKSQVNSFPIPMAGGIVLDNGTKLAGGYSFGTWTSTRTSAGNYQLHLPVRGGCAGLPVPYISVTPDALRLVAAHIASCEPNGSWKFFVFTYTSTLVATDSHWAFTIYG